MIIVILVGVTLKVNKKASGYNNFIETTTELGYSTSRNNETTPETAVEFRVAKKDEYEINFHVTMSDIEKEQGK